MVKCSVRRPASILCCASLQVSLVFHTGNPTVFYWWITPTTLIFIRETLSQLITNTQSFGGLFARLKEVIIFCSLFTIAGSQNQITHKLMQCGWWHVFVIGWTKSTICDVEDGRVGDFYGLFPMSDTDVDSEKKTILESVVLTTLQETVTQNILRKNTHFWLIGK